MDERKDFEKDKIAHPERPLPARLTVAQVDRAIASLAVLLFAVAAAAGVLVNAVAGGFLAAGAIYLGSCSRSSTSARRSRSIR